MRVIKHPLSYGSNKIEVQANKALSLVRIEYQGADLYGWFLEETHPWNEDGHVLDIWIAHTGDVIPEDYTIYLATAQTYDRGYYVVHAFQ